MKHRHIFFLALISCVLASIVILLGVWTRLSDAGLGCPDWPGCYGQLLPPTSEKEVQVANLNYPDAQVDHEKTWPEMIHRYFAAPLIGLICLALGWIAYRDRKQPLFQKHIIVLCAIVLFQALLGMLTVTLKLWPQIVLLHLLGGFTVLSLSFLLCLRSYNLNNVFKIDQSVALYAGCFLFFVIIQIILGGWLSANYAALACLDFPLCQSKWFPTMDFKSGFDFLHYPQFNYLGGVLDHPARTAIHFTHRVGAVVLLIVGMIFSIKLFKVNQVKTGSILLALLCLQIALGIVNVLFSVPLFNAIAHNYVAVLLLLWTIFILYRVLMTKNG